MNKMQSIRYLGICIMATAALMGCATTSPLTTDLPSGTRIGVISCLGPKLRNVLIATTIFTSNWTFSDSSDLKLDDTIALSLSELLGKSKKYDIVNLQATNSQLCELYKSEGSPCCSRKYDINKIKADIIGARDSNDFDYLLLVVEGRFYNHYGHPNELNGYGYARSEFLGLSSATTFIVAELLLVNVESLNIIAKGFLLSNEKIADIPTKEGYHALDQSSQQRIDSALRKQASTAIRRVVQEMRLAQ